MQGTAFFGFNDHNSVLFIQKSRVKNKPEKNYVSPLKLLIDPKFTTQLMSIASQDGTETTVITHVIILDMLDRPLALGPC